MTEPIQLDRAGLARRAALQALVSFAVAAALAWRGRMIMAGVVVGIGAVVLLSGLMIPSLFLKIEQGGRRLGTMAAVGLTWGLLAPMFYLVFFPGRLVLLIAGRDPMARRFPTGAPTYWIPRKPAGSPDEYKRQY